MLTDNLVSYWKLDESSGDAADATGNGYTLTNGGSSGVTYAAGKIGNGAVFANTYPNNNASFGGSFTNLSVFSISLWVKSSHSSAGSEDSGLINAGSWGTSGDLQFRINTNTGVGGKLYFQPYGGNPDIEISSTTSSLFDGNWHHIVAVYDATNKDIIIYIDGSVDYSKTDYTSLPTINFGTNFKIGTWLIGTNYRGMRNGYIDEVGIWSTALTSTEVTTLYNSGDGLAYPFSSGGTNIKINVGDTFKTVSGVKINIGDSWKTVSGAKVNVGDTWKTIF